MITFVAEKPSVATEIARNIGAKTLKEGYYEGHGYAVTWAYGHLIDITCPEGDQKWCMEDIPILPFKFFLVPRTTIDQGKVITDPRALEQLAVIRELFDRSETIVEATDPAAEGELIFRYIYDYLECKKPVFRLWTASMTDSAIRKGLADLKDWGFYDNLYQRAKCRNEADYIVGVNATRTLSLVTMSPGPYHMGRVLTPTLMHVCRRYIYNTDFQPSKYWHLDVVLMKDGRPLTVRCREQFSIYQEAESAKIRVTANGMMKVREVNNETLTEEPPMLYDLTSLQEAAGDRYGYSAQQTEGIVQKLYEKKFVTYPRTSSRCITEDDFNELPALLDSLHKVSFLSVNSLIEKGTTALNRRCVNELGVTDHCALMITDNIPTARMTAEEKNIYSMIAVRMEEAFSPGATIRRTTVCLECEGLEFTAQNSETLNEGWKAIKKSREAKSMIRKDEIPPMHTGESLKILRASLVDMQTEPKPDMTDARLLERMEEFKIGTVATRAEIIESLVTRGYVVREDGYLMPTVKGLSVYYALKDVSLSDDKITAEWEEKLARIEAGTMDPKDFMTDIHEYTRTLVDELQQQSVIDEIRFGIHFTALPCPVCGNALEERQGSVNCPSCGHVIYKTFKGKKIPQKEFRKLITTGECGRITGLVAANGNLFSAPLHLNGEGRIETMSRNTYKAKQSYNND